MKLKSLISQVEYLHGRVPKTYIYQLINDCLDEISVISKMYKKHEIMDLVQAQRLYNLPSDLLQIERVDMLNTDSRYCLLPKLTDGFHLLKNDVDQGKGDYTASNSSTTGASYRQFPNDYFAWFTEGEDLVIVCKRGDDDSSDSTRLDTLTRYSYDTYNGDDVAEAILITYKGKYSHVSDTQLEMDLRDSTGLPEALHPSILDCVKYRLKEDKGDLQTAMYFKQKFDSFVKKYPYSKDGSRRILTTRV
jgi:hypothetical protein